MELFSGKKINKVLGIKDIKYKKVTLEILNFQRACVTQVLWNLGREPVQCTTSAIPQILKITL